MLDATFQKVFRKITCLAIRKAFKKAQVFPRRSLDCTQIKNINNLIFLCGRFIWLMLLFDTQLRNVSHSYTNKSFLSSFFPCLPMKLCSLKYMLNILFRLGTCIAYAYLEQPESWYPCSHQSLSEIFQTIPKSTSCSWNQTINWFQVT